MRKTCVLLLLAACGDPFAAPTPQDFVATTTSEAGGDDASSVDSSSGVVDASAPEDATSFADVATEHDEACASVAHSNGEGQQWTDCVALHTYDQAEATKACAAHGTGCYFVGYSTEAGMCFPGDVQHDGVLWMFLGPDAGKVVRSKGTDCFWPEDPGYYIAGIDNWD